MLTADPRAMPVHQISVGSADWQLPQSLGPANSVNRTAVATAPTAAATTTAATTATGEQSPPPEWTPREPSYAPIVPVIPDHCHSSVSTLSSGNHDICRICHCEGEAGAPLLAPCYCSGSLCYVHQTCLQQWIKASDTRTCELCKFTFIMHAKTKPFSEWEKLEMSPHELRKLWCAITFHAFAALCVTWSLHVLVERTIEEARRGYVDWGFWMKLVIVMIGSTGGLVFMYIQCKTYVMLFRRWRAFNRVIFIQNAPEKVVLPPSPAGSLRDVTVPLKDPSSSMPDLSRSFLPRSVEPPCASQQVKPASESVSITQQHHDAQLKLYVFDKLSSAEDNL